MATMNSFDDTMRSKRRQDDMSLRVVVSSSRGSGGSQSRAPVAKLPPDISSSQTYVIKLRPQPGVDAVRALRAALKVLLRRFGLKAVEVKEEERVKSKAKVS
jgi:hypothetical protein